MELADSLGLGHLFADCERPLSGAVRDSGGGRG